MNFSTEFERFKGTSAFVRAWALCEMQIGRRFSRNDLTRPISGIFTAFLQF